MTVLGCDLPVSWGTVCTHQVPRGCGSREPGDSAHAYGLCSIMKGRNRSLRVNRKSSSMYLTLIMIYSNNKPALIISPVNNLKANYFYKEVLLTFIPFVLCAVIFLGFYFRWSLRGCETPFEVTND